MAIEDAPRLDPDHIQEPKAPESRPLRKGFLEQLNPRSRRLAGDSLGTMIVEGSKIEQEDDDDEDEEFSVGIKPPKKESRGRRLFRSLWPRPEKLAGSTADDPGRPNIAPNASFYESWLARNQSVVEQGVGVPTENVQQQAEHDQERASVNTRPELAFSSGGVSEDEPVQSGEVEETSGFDGNNAEHEISLVSNPEEETESIQTILQRHHVSSAGNTPPPRTPARTTSAGAMPPIPPDGVLTNMTATHEMPTVQVNNYEQHDHYNKAGLTGWDALNYGLAKRRDKKINRASTTRDQELKKIGERQKLELQKQIAQQDQLREKLDNRIKTLEATDVVSNTDHQEVVGGVLKGIKEVAPHKNVYKTTNEMHIDNPVNVDNIATVEAPELTFSTSERRIVAAPDIPLPSAETIFHKVEEAAERNVPIETQYELRHENKGNDNYYIPVVDQARSVVSSSHSAVPQSYAGVDPSKLNIPGNDHQGRTSQYKEVASSGGWGIVVGIVIFIIMYMITSG